METAAKFPLSVDTAGRFLRTAGQQPFRLQCEFAWTLATMATQVQIDTYLADRQARGFNSFEMMAVVFDTADPPPFDWPRANLNGDEPFTSVGDLSTASGATAYWAFVDLIIDKAAARGMAVLLYPLYAGYGGSQWWTVVASNSQANCQSYGTFIGNRYKNKTNVVWMFGGDYAQPNDATRTKYVAFVDALRATGALQIAGSEWGDPDMLVTDQSGYTYGTNPATAHMQLDSFYCQGPGVPGPAGNGLTYATADRSWVRSSPILPGFACETPQFANTYLAISSDQPNTRKYYYWAATAGAIAGTNMGDQALANACDFTRLAVACFDDAQIHHALFQTLKWWLMVPSGTSGASAHGSSGSTAYCGRVLIVSGAGSGSSLITSSLASDGSQLIAYVPPTGTGTTTFSVDLRSMSGTCTAYWFSPLSGALTTAGTFANSLSAQSFTTPSAAGRSDSSNDWMLVCKVPN